MEDLTELSPEAWVVITRLITLLNMPSRKWVPEDVEFFRRVKKKAQEHQKNERQRGSG